MSNRVIGGLTKSVLAALVLLCVAEIGLRLVLGLGSPVLIAPDPDQSQASYGYIPAPDQDKYRFFARNKINHYSMRSDDIDEAKDITHIRIMFIGDSVTYGTTYLDQSKIFTSLLAQNLPEYVHKKVDILNVSAGGWAPANEVAFLMKKGTFNADLVLIVLNTADLNQPFAAFEPNPNAPTEKPLTALGELWTRYIAPRFLNDQNARPDPGSMSSQPTRIDQETSDVLKTLERGMTYAAAHNAKFGIVYVPSHSKNWDGPDYNLAKSMLKDWMGKNKIFFIDTSQALNDFPSEKTYLDKGEGKIHLTPFAHQIVSKRIQTEVTALFLQS